MRLIYGQELLTKEISEIADIVGNELTEEVKERATKIAFDYYKDNENTDPETVARASFYIALKEFKCNPENSVYLIINNHGKRNRWWLYVVPLVKNTRGANNLN